MAKPTDPAIVKARLKVQALPKPVDPAYEALARDEIRLRVMGAADPAGELYRIAQGDDELAAVVTHGAFAESLLRSLRVGAKESKEAATTINRIAVESAAQSTDPRRKAASEALASLDALQPARAE